MEAPAFLLETPRLGLRRYRVEDLDVLATILCDAETMRYYPRPFTREEASEWIGRNLDRYREDGFGLWAIVLKETGEFLGNCGPVKRTVGGRDEVELGWHVTRSRWREGFATEAAAECRDYSFGSLGLNRLIALVRPENIPSRRVAEKIGMIVESEIEYGSMSWPHLVYAVHSGRT